MCSRCNRYSITALLSCFYAAAISSSDVLAFQISSTLLVPHHSRPPHHSHTHNAKKSDGGGYDDWYIDDNDDNNDNNNNIVSDVSSESSIPNSDDDDDDDDKENNIRSYFATCIPGLHQTLSNELISLGALNVETQGKSGVRFRGSPTIGLKAILWCRTAHKIMERIASSSDSIIMEDDDNDESYDNGFTQGIRNRDDLNQFIRSSVHTPSLLGDGEGGLLTLSVSTIFASKPPKELCHSHYTALEVKNALVDSVRELRDDGDRPSVDIDNSDVPLVVVLKGRKVNDDNSWRDGRRGGRRNNNSYYEDGDDFSSEMVADVDLYRCLHSNGSLHRRGYRRGGDDNIGSEYGDESSNTAAPIHRAAMKETLAAGLLLEAGWDKLVLAARGDGKGAVLVDPMTGSGTLAVEAALIACDMAPGLCKIASWKGDGRMNPHRVPPCLRWKDFTTQKEWDVLIDKATQRAKSGMKWARSLAPDQSDHKNVQIIANEKNPGAASLAQSSIRSAGVGGIVSLSEGDCLDWNLGGGGEPNSSRDIIEGRTIFVCNPPWGLRLTEDIDESWVSLREFFRREAGGCEAWILSGNADLTKILRMKKSRSVVVKTSDEDLRWLQYHIFQKSQVVAQ